MVKRTYFCYLIIFLFWGCKDLLDDPNNERLGISIEKELLISPIWKVEYSNDDQTTTTAFQGSFIEFNEDNTLNIITNDRDVFNAEWALSSNNDLLVIQSDGKIPSPFNEIENEWVIREADDVFIRMEEQNPTGGDEAFSFFSANTRELPQVCDQVGAIVSSKDWHVQIATLNNENVTAEFEAFTFDFNATGKVVVKSDTMGNFEGYWNAGIRCDEMLFQFDTSLPIGKIDEISWQVAHLTDQSIRLTYVQDLSIWELLLSTKTANLTDFCESTQLNISNKWKLEEFLVGNSDISNVFEDFSFEFMEDSTFFMSDGQNDFVGNWLLLSNCEIVNIDYEGNELFQFFSENWKIVLLTSDHLQLSTEINNTQKSLSFHRPMLPPPGGGVIVTCQQLQEVLIEENRWKIVSLKVNDEDNSSISQIVDVTFDQKGNAVFVLDEDLLVIGSYTLSPDCLELRIIIESEDARAKQLAKNWSITEFSQDRIAFSISDPQQNATMIIELEL